MGDLSGEAMDAARRREEMLLARAQSSAHSDGELGAVLHDASRSAEQFHQRLEAIRHAVDEGAARAADTTNTSAGKRAFQRFLMEKHRQILQVVDDARQSSTTLTSQIRTATYTKTDQVGADPLDNKFRPVDSKDQLGDPDQPQPQVAIDPRNPFIGDERFGHWVDVIPPPYVGSTPPPPWTGHRPVGNVSLEGGPTGFYSPGGKTWADDSAAPGAYLEEQYRFRIAGEDYTKYTRLDPVDGHQQQWVAYTYEAQKWTRVPINLNVWAPKAPNEITGELGGVNTGSLSGVSPPPFRGPWQPMTLPQIATLSAKNPDVHYYMPDDCGFQFAFVNGSATGGRSGLPPIIPSMIAEPP